MSAKWKTVADEIARGLESQLEIEPDEYRDSVLKPAALGYLHGFGVAIAERLGVDDEETVGSILGGLRQVFGDELGDDIMAETDKYVMPFDPMKFMVSLGVEMEANEKFQDPAFLAAVQVGAAEGTRFVDNDVTPGALGRFLRNQIARS